jgi:hypothetical protein
MKKNLVMGHERRDSEGGERGGERREGGAREWSGRGIKRAGGGGKLPLEGSVKLTKDPIKGPSG